MNSGRSPHARLVRQNITTRGLGAMGQGLAGASGRRCNPCSRLDGKRVWQQIFYGHGEPSDPPHLSRRRHCADNLSYHLACAEIGSSEPKIAIVANSPKGLEPRKADFAGARQIPSALSLRALTKAPSSTRCAQVAAIWAGAIKGLG